MDKQLAAADIVRHAMPLVAFEGWNMPMLQKAAEAAGYKKTDAIRVFPGGAIEAVNFFFRQSDAQLSQAAQAYHLESMKIRERIALLVRLRLEAVAPHREAVRKALALYAMPFYLPQGLASLYRTVDEIWHLAGDQSTDFNFYSKRALLAGVYSSTLLVFLDDRSPGFEGSWAFLSRRIEQVMLIEKAKHRLKGWAARAYSL
jgi:ubiquinone biosynthesis protein COQ9